MLRERTDIQKEALTRAEEETNHRGGCEGSSRSVRVQQTSPLMQFISNNRLRVTLSGTDAVETLHKLLLPAEGTHAHLLHRL